MSNLNKEWNKQTILILIVWKNYFALPRHVSEEHNWDEISDMWKKN